MSLGVGESTPDSRYGISYTLDSSGALLGTFEGRALAPQTEVRLYTVIGDSLASPQIGGLANDSGNVSLAIQVRGAPCAAAVTPDDTLTVMLIGVVGGNGEFMRDTSAVECPMEPRIPADAASEAGPPDSRTETS